MKTATLEEIHADPHRLDALIAAGEPVEVLKDGEAIAEITPRQKHSAAANPPPDYWRTVGVAARLKRIWGDERMTEAEAAAMLERSRGERRFPTE